MSEPRRWSEEGPPPEIERLLEAAASERPADAGLTRTLAALGVGASAATAAGTAGAAGAAAAGAGSAAAGAATHATGLFAVSALGKWALVATVLTAGATGTVVARRWHAATAGAASASPSGVMMQARSGAGAAPLRSPAPTAPAARAAENASELRAASEIERDPAPSAGLPSAQPVTAHSARKLTSEGRGSDEGARARTAPGGTPNAASTTPSTSTEAPIDAEHLAEEVAVVDRARAALAKGRATATLAALDEYGARFTRRRFEPEALYLRMEALLALGRKYEAASVAARIVQEYPKSPHAARALQVREQGPYFP